MKTEKMKTAFRLGIEAYANGMKCIPAHDKAFLALLHKGIPFCELTNEQHQESMAIGKAWLQGFLMALNGASAPNPPYITDTESIKT